MMSPPRPTADEPLLNEPPNFSLVLGGPLHHLWRRTRLSGNVLEFLRRRIIVLVLLTWVPPLLLSVAEGHAWGGGVKLPFLQDIWTQVRLLIALPLLILAELFSHQRMRPMVGQFLSRGLIPDAARAQYDAAITSVLRLRNSVTPEVLLIAFVYGIGPIWNSQIAENVTSWHDVVIDGKVQLTLAGWWMRYVSRPLFQFLVLRWYFRLLIWARFLWQVSRIKLQFIPTHPDRCGGMGFLAMVGPAFAPFLLAQGAVLSGRMANSIFFEGAKLQEFELDLIAIVSVMVFVILGPLLVFVPKLADAKRAGLREYGVLAQRYTREFDQKWLRGGAPAGEPLLGSGDIQSLADLGNSYAVVKEMRLVPFTIQTVLQLAAITLLPVAPLLLSIIPLQELLERLLKTLF